MGNYGGQVPNTLKGDSKILMDAKMRGGVLIPAPGALSLTYPRFPGKKPSRRGNDHDRSTHAAESEHCKGLPLGFQSLKISKKWIFWGGRFPLSVGLPYPGQLDMITGNLLADPPATRWSLTDPGRSRGASLKRTDRGHFSGDLAGGPSVTIALALHYNACACPRKFSVFLQSGVFRGVAHSPGGPRSRFGPGRIRFFFGGICESGAFWRLHVDRTK
jgi:hypothetical protein